MAKPVASTKQNRGNIANLKPWPKGVSGNPAGRKPRTEAQKAEAQALKQSEKAMAKLVKLIDSDDERVALAAAQALLDRGLGKPKQTVDSTVTQKRDVADIDDAELAAIARSGSEGAATSENGTQESDSLH